MAMLWPVGLRSSDYVVLWLALYVAVDRLRKCGKGERSRNSVETVVDGARRKCRHDVCVDSRSIVSE